jgi:hypothetical protein
MNERIEKIKDHIDRHRVAYSCVATGIVVAGFTAIIMKGRYEAAITGAYGLETADTSVTIRPFFLNFFAKQDSTISSTVHRGGTGSPSYIIECDEIPNVAWLSQRAASIETGIQESKISAHLNGKFPDADGFHFRRIGVAVA